MKIDMHTHCRPVSVCAHHEPELLPEMFLKKGIVGIVLTNHYYPAHCNKLSSDLKEQAKIYVDVYQRAKVKGEQVGFKVFFGAEIKLINEPNKPEFLLYGISEQDFIASYPLYSCTQKELFEFCNEKDILMVQSHPYRIEQGYTPADMQYVHGIEVYNPHPHFDSRIDQCINLAEQNDKIKTAGSDFHIQSQAGAAGMIFSDWVNDQFMLRDCLKKEKQIIFDKNGVIYESK